MGAVDTIIEWTGIVLLFCLVFGMSATVDIEALQTQLKNRHAIMTGLFLQFVVLPMLGFFVVKMLHLDHATGITLLVVTSSPGGSYSNWWCSMFNGDLALSVAMTAISTLASTVMMPLNLFCYAQLAFNEDDLVSTLDWGSLIFALVVVIAAIGSGLYASSHYGRTHPEFNLQMNRLGNFAGVSLVMFSAIMSNADEDSRVYDREGKFYAGVALPCVMGLILANLLTTALGLAKPERVTVSIECCYQNVGIATSVALSMFDDEDQARAVAVPFFYGGVEAVLLLIYCITAWKMDWTKAPSNVSFWKMISTPYEVVGKNKEDANKVGEKYVAQRTEEEAAAAVGGDYVAVTDEDTAGYKAPSNNESTASS